MLNNGKNIFIYYLFFVSEICALRLIGACFCLPLPQVWLPFFPKLCSLCCQRAKLRWWNMIYFLEFETGAGGWLLVHFVIISWKLQHKFSNLFFELRMLNLFFPPCRVWASISPLAIARCSSTKTCNYFIDWKTIKIKLNRMCAFYRWQNRVGKNSEISARNLSFCRVFNCRAWCIWK